MPVYAYINITALCGMLLQYKEVLLKMQKHLQEQQHTETQLTVFVLHSIYYYCGERGMCTLVTLLLCFNNVIKTVERHFLQMLSV